MELWYQKLKPLTETLKQFMNSFSQLSMKLWNPCIEATKILSNAYWKLLLNWLFYTSTIVKTTTHHYKMDNEKMVERCQNEGQYIISYKCHTLKITQMWTQFSKIYIYNVHTHEIIQFNKNIEKSSPGKNIKSSVCVIILYGTLFCNFILTVALRVI